MFCPRCGASNVNSGSFCSSCGNPIQVNGGKITFHRIGRFLGCAVGIPVEVDGVKVGTLANNGTFTINIPFGMHKVVFNFWSGIGNTDIMVTEEYPNVFVDVKLKAGLLTNKIEIIDIRRER